jgi:hypothetical protein
MPKGRNHRSKVLKPFQVQLIASIHAVGERRIEPLKAVEVARSCPEDLDGLNPCEISTEQPDGTDLRTERDNPEHEDQVTTREPRVALLAHLIADRERL